MNPSAYSAPSDGFDTRKIWTLAVLATSLAIIIIDSSIVNVTIQAIRHDFNASLRDLEWISATYALVYASLIITWGRLGDALGRRRVFIAGIITFMIGSIVVGAAQNIGMIVVGRAIQGFGAAMASPSTLSILSSTFTGKARGVAFGIWGATAGAGGALGPLIGGLLTTYATWRWAFFINIPIVLFGIIGSLLFITESRDAQHAPQIDILGIFLISIGLGALVFGLIEGQTYGWLTSKETFSIGSWNWPFTNIAFAAAMFIVAFIFLLSFILYENLLLRIKRIPLFDFSLLRFRGFRFGLMTVGIIALGEFGILFVLSLYFQGVRGLTALQTGLILLPFAIGSFFTAPIAGILSSKFGPKWIVTTGMLLEALGIFLISRVTTVNVPLGWFIPIFLLYGIGLGLAIAQLTNVVLSDIPREFAGAGSGANNTIRQIGSAIGVAILSALLAAQISSTAQTELARNTIIPSYIKPAVQQAFDNGQTSNDVSLAPSSTKTGNQGGMPTGGIHPPTGVTSPPSPQIIGAQIKDVFNISATNGTRSAALMASIFVLLGALSSFLIPNSQSHLLPTNATENKQDDKILTVEA